MLASTSSLTYTRRSLTRVVKVFFRTIVSKRQRVDDDIKRFQCRIDRRSNAGRRVDHAALADTLDAAFGKRAGRLLVVELYLRNISARGKRVLEQRVGFEVA